VSGSKPSEAVVRITWANPAHLFCLFSLVVGSALVAINPPLRGPDESAHFVRIYSIGEGELIPGNPDALGRRGVMLPSDLYRDFSFFEVERAQQAESRKGIRTLFEDFWKQREAAERAASGLPDPQHQPYGGSEAYSLAPYLPYIPVAISSQKLSLSFLSSFYALRLSGLLILTALTAYAIAIVPNVKWAFFSISMLPSALYGRCVLSADGLALTATLVLAALCLRAAGSKATDRPALRSFWMTVSVLTKPAQAAFVLLEGVTDTLSGHLRHSVRAALIVLPGLALTVLWLILGSADVASWRFQGHGESARDFDIAWKMRFLFEHPLHFPTILLTSLDQSIELGRQLIGVMGWLDTPLLRPMYPALALLMVLAFLHPLDREKPNRRIAFWSAATVLAYITAIFLIFFLAFTPTGSDRILGVQGRYFVVVLPSVALLIASLIPRQIPAYLPRAGAILGACIGSLALIEAIVRVNW
jgi:uncharacterized membrane protein